MLHTHLLPDDIELLVDDADGPEAARLLEHVASCDACRAELDLALQIELALERMPHEEPAPGFQNRVMARVQVFEPWHVALTDAVRRLVPRQGPVRRLATAGAALMALTVTGLTIWGLTQAELVVYAGRLALARVETALLTAGGTFVSDVFGEAALTAVRDGGTAAVALGVAAVLTALAGAALCLRGLVGLAHKRGR